MASSRQQLMMDKTKAFEQEFHALRRNARQQVVDYLREEITWYKIHDTGENLASAMERGKAVFSIFGLMNVLIGNETLCHGQMISAYPIDKKRGRMSNDMDKAISDLLKDAGVNMGDPWNTFVEETEKM